MPNHPHAFLIDLLAAHGCTAGFSCELEPRLLEMLIDGHTGPAGVERPNRPLRSDGPTQWVLAGWPQIGPLDARTTGAAHAQH